MASHVTAPNILKYHGYGKSVEDDYSRCLGLLRPLLQRHRETAVSPPFLWSSAAIEVVETKKKLVLLLWLNTISHTTLLCLSISSRQKKKFQITAAAKKS